MFTKFADSIRGSTNPTRGALLLALVASILIPALAFGGVGDVAATDGSTHNVTITDPANGTTVAPFESVNFTSDNENVSSVEWYANGSQIDNSTNTSHEFDTVGDYTVELKGLNSSGDVVATDSITVNVEHPVNNTVDVNVTNETSSIFVEAENGTLDIVVDDENGTQLNQTTYTFGDSLELTEFNVSSDSNVTYSVHYEGNASSVNVGTFDSDGDKTVVGGSTDEISLNLTTEETVLVLIVLAGGALLVLSKE
ncbi:hypothetical protein SAMN04487948_1099 [Halogranum amylolyticum]|uniref:PKD domain-containing protein n=1 Tax=Halogranum amylolyticum TaxID=660520 RepID=A0A1H8TZY2_9EURY|nr:Ig-like domain-containing protein [Halogranum amylolyticum]SEO96123.1 hypothetical protein SAMN04487948_1099 [Halogranum amylolyticum]